MPFHGDESLDPKKVKRLEHVYEMLSDRERAASLTSQITYMDILTISLVMNHMYGTVKFLDDKKAASPLYSLDQINQVLAGMVHELEGIKSDFKRNLLNSKRASTSGVDPEPLYMAVHILMKMMFFVNETLFHMCRILPNSEEYRFWDMLKLSLLKAETEHTLRNQRKNKDS